MNLQQRIDLLIRLGQYILSEDERWLEVKENAQRANNWFTRKFIEESTSTISRQFLNAEKINAFAHAYLIPENLHEAKTVGLVMAGNIPLVGFHDLECIFLGGHHAVIKASSKDEILIKHLVEKLCEWDKEINNYMSFGGLLKGCDAYIATGSNNSARYFDYYFGKYPNIIRRNRTSVAILTGEESPSDLEKLADDVHLYFGLGCRNVTKLFVPDAYDFIPLLSAFKVYDYFIDHHKYKNNYDYQLAIHLLNQKYYMSNGSILLSENISVFSPVSQLNYEYYADKAKVETTLRNNNEIQSVIGHGFVPFGQAQSPSLADYPDGVDTMDFILHL